MEADNILLGFGLICLALLIPCVSVFAGIAIYDLRHSSMGHYLAQQRKMKNPKKSK